MTLLFTLLFTATFSFLSLILLLNDLRNLHADSEYLIHNHFDDCALVLLIVLPDPLQFRLHIILLSYDLIIDSFTLCLLGIILCIRFSFSLVEFFLSVSVCILNFLVPIIGDRIYLSSIK